MITISTQKDQLIFGYKGKAHNILLDEMVIGSIGIFWINGKPFSNIFIKSEFRRKGYALEAKKILFANSGLKEIFSYVNKDNKASIKLQYSMNCRLVKEVCDKLLFVWEQNA